MHEGTSQDTPPQDTPQGTKARTDRLLGEMSEILQGASHDEIPFWLRVLDGWTDFLVDRMAIEPPDPEMLEMARRLIRLPLGEAERDALVLHALSLLRPRAKAKPKHLRERREGVRGEFEFAYRANGMYALLAKKHQIGSLEGKTLWLTEGDRARLAALAGGKA